MIMRNRWMIWVLLIGIFLFGSTSMASAQTDDRDITEYWGSDITEATDDVQEKTMAYGSRENIFLKTDNVFVKIGWFIGLSLTAYLIAWILFGMLVKGNSPSRLFFRCFFSFMILLWFIGFICFSEYALSQGFNKDENYLSQLEWIYVAASALVWLIISILTTKFFNGKAVA